VEESAVGTVYGFPAALTSFIGRAGPVREVVGLLEQHRLVTVTGPGGAGKTRLAGEVAKHVASRFADGAWLAELAPVADPAQVAAIVAAALGGREQPGMPAADAVAQALARQQLLLVLDNCEHVIEAAAALCGKLLLACDDVRILATSREPLQVAGEARYRLGPLAVPDRDDLAHSAAAEAVALFAARACSADVHFALDEQTGPPVARIVRRLDGMPLAIELAAARVEALGVTGLLDRLDDRFALLAGGDRMAPSRQRSLEAAVEWSYQLLDERERRVFRAVSVFPGPFTLVAAETVAGRDAGPAVLRLVDCSLLVPPRQGPDGRLRYLMLETLRAYGAARLAETREQDDRVAALARYALEVAEQVAPGLLTTSRELAAAQRLDAEDATMRQALAWAMQHDAAMALRLAVALAPWWLLRGRLAGEYPLLREAVGCAEVGDDMWCTGQWWLGQSSMHAGDAARSLAHFTEVRDAIGDLGPSRALADCLEGRSVMLTHLGRFTEAIEDGRRSLSVAREVGYPACEANALVVLSIAAVAVGDAEGAVRLARQAHQVTDEIPGWLDRVRNNISTSALREAGDLAAAERYCAAGLARSRSVGDLRNLAAMLPQMAELDLQAGRILEATEHLREGLQIAKRAGSGNEMRNCLECCGYLCGATGRYAEALTVWAALIALLPSAPQGPWARREQAAWNEARRAIGPDQAREAEERGAAMSLDIATEYALMLIAPGSDQPATAPVTGQLSARERELISLVAKGRTDAQIAAQLFISVRTVGSHLDRIRDKTGCRRRADLTRLALDAGLV
jgi:predicted ATPase/DNA-binding CsgD family transcriptional regulator